MLLLATSLPEILPYAKDTIHIEYRTGTVTCVDELIPLDESDSDSNGEADPSKPPKLKSDLEKRNKSSLQAVIRIGDGRREVSGKEKKRGPRGGGKKKNGHNEWNKGKGKATTASSDDDMMSSGGDA